MSEDAEDMQFAGGRRARQGGSYKIHSSLKYNMTFMMCTNLEPLTNASGKILPNVQH